MAEETANTVKINVDLEYTFNHSKVNFLESAGLDMLGSTSFKKLFDDLTGGDFEGLKKSQVCQAFLSKNDPEVIKLFIILGMEELFSKLLEFEAMLAAKAFNFDGLDSQDIGQA